MIIAKFYQKPSNGSIHMKLHGHANAAPKGEDLVCSAATMLAYTVAQAVQYLHEEGMLKKKPKIILKEGNATIVATPTEEGYAAVLHTYWVAQCGIQVLQHNYPQYVYLEHLKV